jgi:hypothetical protein
MRKAIVGPRDKSTDGAKMHQVMATQQRKTAKKIKRHQAAASTRSFAGNPFHHSRSSRCLSSRCACLRSTRTCSARGEASHGTVRHGVAGNDVAAVIALCVMAAVVNTVICYCKSYYPPLCLCKSTATGPIIAKIGAKISGRQLTSVRCIAQISNTRPLNVTSCSCV